MALEIAHRENQQHLLNSMVTGCLQGIHGHAHRVRQSSAAEQSQMLKISFQTIAAGLNAGSYQSQEVVKQDIQEICRSAAEAFSSQDQVYLCGDPQFMTDIKLSERVSRNLCKQTISHKAFCEHRTVEHQLGM